MHAIGKDIRTYNAMAGQVGIYKGLLLCKLGGLASSSDAVSIKTDNEQGGEVRWWTRTKTVGMCLELWISRAYTTGHGHILSGRSFSVARTT